MHRSLVKSAARCKTRPSPKLEISSPQLARSRHKRRVSPLSPPTLPGLPQSQSYKPQATDYTQFSDDSN